MTHRDTGEPRRPRGAAVLAVLTIAAALSAAGPAGGGEAKWSLQLEPMFMDVYGHDQHVLTIHRQDLDATPSSVDRSAVTLDSSSGQAYRFELQRTKNQWGVGLDFFWFITSQDTGPQGASAGGGTDAVIFEVADRSFTAGGAGEVLYYDVLEDTDIGVWTLDLYGIRTLAEKPKSALHLRFGVRVGDFDNDYRAVVGIQDVAGRRLNASSNYGQMIGPNVGLTGEVQLGRSWIQAYLGHSVILGTAELSNLSGEFTGPFNEMEMPAFFAEETLFAKQDVALPITELRLKWGYRITDRISLGAGVHASAWWDVPVPPGVIPGPGGDQVLHENTLVYLGTMVFLHFTF